MDNWESLRRPTHPIPDPTHPTLLFERRGATCVTCHVDIDTRDRTTASFFIVLKDFSGSYCSMISTLICLINNNVTDICHFAVTLCYDTAADIQDILVPQKEGGVMCHISHGHVSYGHLNVRRDYDFVLLEDYGESCRNILVSLPLLLYDPDIEIVLFLEKD